MQHEVPDLIPYQDTVRVMFHSTYWSKLPDLIPYVDKLKVMSRAIKEPEKVADLLFYEYKLQVISHST